MASQDSPVVSVRIAKPVQPEDAGLEAGPSKGPAANSGPTLAKPPALTWPQQPCIISGASSAIGAGMLGFFFGAIPSMLRNRRLSAWQLWGADGWRSSLGLGLVSGVYTWVHCLAMRIRLRDDGWNRGMAGCATGLLLGWQGGPVSAAQSCVGLGALSWIVDLAGAGETPPANAATYSDDNINHYNGALPQPLHHIHTETLTSSKLSALPHRAPTHGHVSSCSDMQLHHPCVASSTCTSGGCCGHGTGLSSELTLGLVALARATCALAGTPVPQVTSAPPADAQTTCCPPDNNSQRRPQLRVQPAVELQVSPTARGTNKKQQAGGVMVSRLGAVGHGCSQGTVGGVVIPSRAALPAPESASQAAWTTPASPRQQGGSSAVPACTAGVVRGGSPAPLASVTCTAACGTGPRGMSQWHNHQEQGKAALAAAASLLSWPHSAGDIHRSPVMWLGQVMARPYFQQPSL